MRYTLHQLRCSVMYRMMEMESHGHNTDSLDLKGISEFVKQVLIKAVISKKYSVASLGRWNHPILGRGSEQTLA